MSGQDWRRELRLADCESSLGEEGESQYARGLHAWRWARTGFWVGLMGMGRRGVEGGKTHGGEGWACGHDAQYLWKVGGWVGRA